LGKKIEDVKDLFGTHDRCAIRFMWNWTVGKNQHED